jgi:hypothetical protein
VQPTLDTPPRPHLGVTPIWRRSNNHRAILTRQTIIPTTKRTIRRTYIVPPYRDLFFPGRHGAYEGVGPPGWSVTAFRVPPRPGSTGHEERSTQHLPAGRPRPCLDTSRHPRTTTTKPHM